MWIFAADSFISAVEHRSDANYLMIRARDKKSLENLVAGSQMAGHAEGEVGLKYEDIYTEKNSDYAWRVVVSKATFAIYMQFEILNFLTYPNFKSEAAKYRSGPWMTALHNVWSDMNRVDEAEKPKYGAYEYHPTTGGGRRDGDYYSNMFGSGEYRGSDDELYPGYAGYHQTPMFRDGEELIEPSDEELAKLETEGYTPSVEDNIDYLKGRFAEDGQGNLKWTPFSEDELKTLHEEGFVSDYYNGETFFRKNAEGQWVDINDTAIPVLPESD